MSTSCGCRDPTRSRHDLILRARALNFVRAASTDGPLLVQQAAVERVNDSVTPVDAPYCGLQSARISFAVGRLRSSA
jgi:hypothetical protein